MPLLGAVTDDEGRRIGWRPMGGGVEFDETSREVVAHEMAEEPGALSPTRHLGVLEHVREHHGAPGHEVVFARQGAMDDPGPARAEAFAMVDCPFADRVEWLDPVAPAAGGPLMPDGLLAVLGSPLAPGAATA